MNQDEMVKILVRTTLISTAVANTNAVPAAVLRSLLANKIIFSDSSDTIYNMWSIRNDCVTNLGMEASFFTIDLLLGNITTDYFKANDNVIDTLLHLVDENGAQLFASLPAFLIEAANVTVSANCQDVFNIDDWKSYQKISVDNSIVLASDLVTVIKTWTSIKLRITFASTTGTTAQVAGPTNDFIADTTTATRAAYIALAFTTTGDVADPSVTAALNDGDILIATIAYIKLLYPTGGAIALLPAPCPETSALTLANYATSSVDKAFQLIKSVWLNVTPSIMVSSVYSLFTSTTFIYENYINKSLLSQYYPLIKLSDVVTFFKTGVTATDLKLPYYNILSDPAITTASAFLGVFTVLSVLGYSAAEAYKVCQSVITSAAIATEFDGFFGDYVKNLPLLTRLGGLSTATIQQTLSSTFLLGTDKVSDIYDTVFNNSKTDKSILAQIGGSAYTTTNVNTVSSANLYAAAVAAAVKGLTGKYSVGSIVVSGTATADVAGGALTFTNAAGSVASYTAFKTGAKTAVVKITNVGSTTTAAPTIADVSGLKFTPIMVGNTSKTFGAPLINNDTLYTKAVNPNTAVFSKVLSSLYTLSTATAQTNAPAGPYVLVSLLTGAGATAFPVPSATLLTVTENLNALYKAIATANNVSVVNVVIAANANNNSDSTSEKLIVQLYTNDSIPLQQLLSLPAGNWSNDETPCQVFVNIIRNAATLDVEPRPYINALLDFAKEKIHVVLATDVIGDAEVLEKLIFAARNDTDKNSIFLMMGANTESQLATISALLAVVNTNRISEFKYYLNQFTIFQLVDVLGEVVNASTLVNVSTLSINTATNGATITGGSFSQSYPACTNFWPILYANQIELLVPHIPAEVLLTFARNVNMYSATTNNSVGQVSRLVFNFNDVVKAYKLTEQQVAVLKENLNIDIM
jgi:hypothetical protein